MRQEAPTNAGSSDTRRVAQALNQAWGSFRLGDLKQAEADCKRIINVDRNCLDAVYLLTAIELHLGRPKEALEDCERILTLKPDHVEALCNRGNALQQLGRLEEALASYEKALRIKPNLLEVLSNRGNVLKALGRFEEALANFDKALAVNPSLAAALNARGATLHDLGRYEEALASYNKAIMEKSSYAVAFNNRGVTLEKLKRFNEALANYDEALKISPNYADAYGNKAILLLSLGQFEESKRNIERAISLAPNDLRFYRILISGKKITGDDRYLDAVEKLARNVTALSADEQIDLHFSLGKAYADLGQHEKSFKHFLQGNAIKRTKINYDEKKTLKLFNRIETVFTRDLISKKRGFGNSSTVPVFIIGMPRSGTTLVEQILASHSKIFGAGELDDFKRAAAFAVTQPGNAMSGFPDFVSMMSADQFREVGTYYLNRIQTLAPTAQRITDKGLENVIFVGIVHLVFPNARIIHIRRDPIDTCLSCFSQLFTSDHPYAYELSELGRYCRAYERLMEHWRRVLPEGAILEVQYEDLVTDLEPQARRLIEYCGLPWEANCLAFYDTERPVVTASVTQVRQPVYISSIGRWHSYGNLLQPMVDAYRS